MSTDLELEKFKKLLQDEIDKLNKFNKENRMNTKDYILNSMAPVTVTEDDVEINNDDLRDSKLSDMLFDIFKDYNIVYKLINHVSMTNEIKQVLFLNFKTMVKPQLLSLPTSVTFSELLKYILQIAYKIMLPENEFRNAQKQLKNDILPAVKPKSSVSSVVSVAIPQTPNNTVTTPFTPSSNILDVDPVTPSSVTFAQTPADEFLTPLETPLKNKKKNDNMQTTAAAIEEEPQEPQEEEEEKEDDKPQSRKSNKYLPISEAEFNSMSKERRLKEIRALYTRLQIHTLGEIGETNLPAQIGSSIVATEQNKLILMLITLDSNAIRVKRVLDELGYKSQKGKTIESFPVLNIKEGTRIVKNTLNVKEKKQAFYNLFYKVCTGDSDLIDYQQDYTGYANLVKIGQKKGIVEQVTVGQIDLNIGAGLKQKRMGGGLPDNSSKYVVDINKLRNTNFLDIRYRKNKHLVPIRPRIVSDTFKGIVLHKLETGEFHEEAYNTLSNQEHDYFNQIAKYLEIDPLDLTEDENLMKRWEIIKGELLAGNDNKELKKEAKKFLLHFFQTGTIKKKDMETTIMSLDL